MRCAQNYSKSKMNRVQFRNHRQDHRQVAKYGMQPRKPLLVALTLTMNMTTRKITQEVGQRCQLDDRGCGRMLTQRESRISNHEITRSAKLGNDLEHSDRRSSYASQLGSAARLKSLMRPVFDHGQTWVLRGLPVLLERAVYQES